MEKANEFKIGDQVKTKKFKTVTNEFGDPKMHYNEKGMDEHVNKIGVITYIGNRQGLDYATVHDWNWPLYAISLNN